MKNKVISMTLLTIAMIILSGCGANNNEKKIALAQCLTEKGAIMYGTNRCSHCNNQKEDFGYEAFSKINFIDCDRNKNSCELAGVQGFPTWVLGDKTKLEGEQSLEKLAEAAGCEYMTSNVVANEIPSPTPAITANTGS